MSATPSSVAELVVSHRFIGLDSDVLIYVIDWCRGPGDRDLPDAVHLATVRRRGATAFVTNDRRVRARPGIEVVLLAGLASERGA